ncbi:hypothetical protein V6N13_129235 [Hibiscus sabdariffa]|uniref:Uncharacterized protein n=2 Tax=Hibiscus sabdariffa TaxID=183260 RepID=A0ABR2AJ73_9ROSI
MPPEQNAWTPDSSVVMAPCFISMGRVMDIISLVTDPNLLINARFICLRSAGQTRDYAWLQAIRVLFGSETFSLEAKQSATWDEEFDHLEFYYNGNDIVVLEGHLSSWKSLESDLTVEKTSDKNSVLVTFT